MTYDTIDFKIPCESSKYRENSEFVRNQIDKILATRLDAGDNKIFINTNLVLGLPLENINKIAGPLIEAWAGEVFMGIREDSDNKYNLINVEVQPRLGIADIILQFRKYDSVLTGSIDVKATSEDIKKSGKSPNITSFARIRTEYIVDPDFIFIILSIKHKVYSYKNFESGFIDNVMEITDFKTYDLKYISEKDISYNPALGTGQIQIKDIHYVDLEYRTTWEFCQMLDKKYLKSTRRNIQQFIELARIHEWTK